MVIRQEMRAGRDRDGNDMFWQRDMNRKGERSGVRKQWGESGRDGSKNSSVARETDFSDVVAVLLARSASTRRGREKPPIFGEEYLESENRNYSDSFADPVSVYVIHSAWGPLCLANSYSSLYTQINCYLLQEIFLNYLKAELFLFLGFWIDTCILSLATYNALSFFCFLFSTRWQVGSLRGSLIILYPWHLTLCLKYNHQMSDEWLNKISMMEKKVEAKSGSRRG